MSEPLTELLDELRRDIADAEPSHSFIVDALARGISVLEGEKQEAVINQANTMGELVTERDALRVVEAENLGLREALPSLISFALAGPTNAASVAARDAAVDRARAALASSVEEGTLSEPSGSEVTGIPGSGPADNADGRLAERLASSVEAEGEKT